VNQDSEAMRAGRWRHEVIPPKINDFANEREKTAKTARKWQFDDPQHS
jgi:hypothetical protein